ncbi:MAG: LPXTG cell wall anchor domain-containing protein [Pseudomonadales bacterium]|nr:LPXTG cell wall anchor domain-containing protein [Pseudomonadales bacterium]
MTALLLLVAAIVAVIATELGGLAVLKLMPPSVDLTSHYFLLVVAPAVLAASLLVRLLFTRLFRQQPIQRGAVFVSLWGLLQALLLAQTGNTATDILLYLAFVVGLGGAVTLLFNRRRVAA